MKYYKNTSVAWVSPDARMVWSEVFEDLNRTFIISILNGVHEGRWPARTIRLYGGSWLFFLSLVKKYQVVYSQEIISHLSSPGRLYYAVSIRNENATVDKSTQLKETGSNVGIRSFWDLAVGSQDSKFISDTLIEHEPTTLSLMFLEDLGLSLFAETPSNLACKEYTNLITEHLQWMEQTGYKKEAGLTTDVLSWPLEWSSLHGIEEIRFPVVKLMNTNWQNPYDQKHTVRIKGSLYPYEGALGLGFPFQQKKFRPVSDSDSFKKGIIHNTSGQS